MKMLYSDPDPRLERGRPERLEVSSMARTESQSLSGPRVRPLLMTMAEIATLAQVRRPVVTTWRRRYPGFPPPAGGNASAPLFDGRLVAEWLTATGRDPDGRVESDLSLHALVSVASDLAPADLVALLTALVCLRHQDGELLAAAAGDVRDDLMGRAACIDPGDVCLRSEIALLPADAVPLAEGVDDLVEAAWGTTRALEWILAAGHRFHVVGPYARMVAPGLARLIAELSGSRERASEHAITVCDPVAGAGELLAAVADAVGSDHELVFQAAETDPYLARLAGRRMAVHGVGWADISLAVAQSVPTGWADPDVIVTQIPYLPGENRSPDQVIERLDDIALRLAPGCTAVVLGPASVLADGLKPYSPAERARTELISSGVVEAIIRLPGGLVPFRPGYDVAVWVLTPAYQSPYQGRVLLADVSGQDLAADVIADLVEDVVTWRRDGYEPRAHTRVFSTQVPVSALVADPRPLTAPRPARPSVSGTTASELVGRVTELEAALDQADTGAARPRPPLHTGVAAASLRRAPEFRTIGELAKAGRLTIVPGTRLRSVPAGPDGHHDILGAPEVLGRTQRGARRIDRVALASVSRARLTEPGDVIVTTTPEFGVLVDHAGLAVVEFPARILRIPATERDALTPRTLAALLREQVPGLRPPGSVRPGQRLDNYALSILSPAEIQFLDHILAELDARQDQAQRELDLITELRDVTTAGLVDGTLTLTEPLPEPESQ